MKGNRAAKIAFWSGIAAALISAVGAYGSGFGLWHFTVGFLGIAAGLLLAVVALVAGIVALVRRAEGKRRHAVVGMIAAAGLLGVMGYWIDRGRGAPPIHDVTTDLSAPPQFRTIPPRRDSFTVMKGGETGWRAMHAKAYGDIRPVVLPVTQAEAMAKAKSLVEARGWAVAATTADRIEATDTVSPFRFKDDVVIVLTPVAGGTRVDMRSVSRVGVGDVGVNARRVRDFLADLQRG